jgi:bacterioferritin
MKKQDFVDALNEDLASEYRSIIQYIQHISSVKGAKYQQTLQELDKHLAQELQHAMTLARQIDFLGGTATNVTQPFETKTEARAALQQDLALEERQLQRYRSRVAQATELGLPDVAEALSPLLEQTQDHIRELRAAVNGGADAVPRNRKARTDSKPMRAEEWISG